MTLPCPAELWPRFSRLLDHGLALPEIEREAWLAALEGKDATLRPALARALIAAVAPAIRGFLETPALLADAGGFEPGGIVGPFRLLRRLGEGGMGEVWLADRVEEGPKRQVAIKLPHAFLMGPAARARFERERDVVAALAHPNIAQLYEAGVSADNVPYLAFEYVDGTPVTTWCRENCLDLHQRLALAEQILDALGYAHRWLFVHRDVKPSNILVTTEGRVKLLDFGIAKLLGDVAEAGGLTQPTARLATPDYAAPEQLEGAAVTVSTDLFAAGAVFFELLTGARPFASPWRPPDQEAPPASSRADAEAAGSPLGPRLARALRGDLDAVLAKALAPDAARRYPSADAFARDLARFRAGLPVSARRVGLAVRAGKFVRRQPLASALAVAFVLAVSGGLGGVMWQSRRVEHAAARADVAAARANMIKDFLISVFKAEDPRAPRDKPPDEVTAKELLDAAAMRVDSEFAGDPKTRLEILETLAGIYEFMEDVPRAEALEARRTDLTRRLYGPSSPVTLRAMLDQAWDDEGFDDYARAKSVLTQVRDIPLARSGAPSHERALWLMDWAYALRATPGTRAERQRDLAKAARIFAAERPTPDDYPTAQMLLAGAEMGSNRIAEALKIFNQAAAADRAMGEFDPVEAMIYDIDSAQALMNLGAPDEADRRYRAAANLADRALGPRSTGHFQSLSMLADMLHHRGERSGAAKIFQGLKAEVDRADAPPAMAMLVKMRLGEALVAEGRPAAALPVLGASLASAKARPRDVADLPTIEQALGEANDQLGRRHAAALFLSAARTAWMIEGPASAPWVLGARERWARYEIEVGAVAIAEAECQSVVRASDGAPSAPVALAQADLARLALRRGDLARARDESATALMTMGAATELYDVRDWIPVWRTRASVLAASRDAGGATAWAKRASDAARRYGAP